MPRAGHLGGRACAAAPAARTADDAARPAAASWHGERPRFGYRRRPLRAPRATRSTTNGSRGCAGGGGCGCAATPPSAAGRPSTAPSARLRRAAPPTTWALDYQFDATSDGRRIKLLNIVDEFTREAFAVAVDRSIDADATVAVLEDLVTERCTAPEFVRMDNGPS